MKLLFLSLLLSSALGATQVDLRTHRHVLKNYIHMRDVVFCDGHFRCRREGKTIKLVCIRANNAGTYYVPKDVCTRKYLHQTHEDNKHMP
jgi:hypothetical protein